MGGEELQGRKRMIKDRQSPSHPLTFVMIKVEVVWAGKHRIFKDFQRILQAEGPGGRSEVAEGGRA
jgi:hypothetical protein